MGNGNAVYALVAVGLTIMYGLPRFTKLVPAPLVGIVVLTGAAAYFSLDVPTVGDMGELPSALPWVALPAVPLTLQTLQVVAPYAVALTFIGLLGSLLTAQIVDDMTDTTCDEDRESPRAGHRQRLHRLPRRHGGLRRDSPVEDQHRVRRTHPAVVLGRFLDK